MNKVIANVEKIVKRVEEIEEICEYEQLEQHEYKPSLAIREAIEEYYY